MSALIYKDWCVMWKQMRFFFVFILILSAIPSAFNQVFAVVYAAMLPYTSMAYDERSHWNQLAAMMPFSPADIVVSKYALGWIFVGGAAVISALIQFVLSLVIRSTSLSLAVLFLSVCSALCILAITLPLMFRFGVEKGRLVMFLIIFFVCGAAGALSSVVENPRISSILNGPILLFLPVLAVVLTLVSIPLSLWLQRRQEP